MNNTEEIWVDIPGYDGFYQISNKGRVKTTAHQYARKERILKGIPTGGYLYVKLSRHKKQKRYYIRRLVAEMFIPNPLKLPVVNHKDECKSNNCAENLEWCSHSYNLKYGGSQRRRQFSNNVRRTKTAEKTVKQFSLDGLYIATYRNQNVAARINNMKHASDIGRCARGHRPACGGYIWRYE